MACPIDPADLVKLEQFVTLCAGHPQLLNLPQLAFFKNFVEKLGGTVPTGMPSFGANAPKSEAKEEKPAPAAEEKVESEPESDVELDMEGCVEGDTDPDQPMGDSNKESTEEELDKASELRSKAAEAFSDQKFDEAVQLFTEAILLNPNSAMYYAKRGQAFLKLTKPNACIRDCSRALEINPDSATAYKFRGRAYRLLGKWEEAAKDLRQACKLDFDEQADEWLKEVTPNATKIEQHKLKQERRRQEKELQERKERIRKAQEANRKAAEENARNADDDRFGGTGGLGGDADEILNAFKDPEVAAALQDIMSNPASIGKYQNNPKVMNLVTKMAMKMGGEGGAGGFPGFPGAGGFPGFPGAGGAGFNAAPPSGGGAGGGPKCTDDLD
ncbi:hsc70-interacting protein 1-like [Uranotaenia lowii]|uniref:hsc70-interacting protein 1-like n=1 Tax=Uranotaenia lowii TaxID=190385 RepID=UPI00247A9740|nr:hsc70-interacting protein 1-like [Uranotaenia lowii]